MQKSQFQKYSLLGQIGLWFIFFMISFLEQIPYEPFFDSFIYALNYAGILAIMIYVHYYKLLPIYLKGNRLTYLGSTILMIIILGATYTLIDENLPFESEYADDEGDEWQYIVYDILLIILVLAVSSLYYFVEKWQQNIQKESLLKTEKLQAELNFLKSQINPHFLFNTLNNIYSFAQTDNPKTAPMLERLSSILRFMVYDCSEKQVELSKELQAVEDLLEIYKMKNSEQRNIHFVTEGIKRFHLVAPLIIVNFIENAFKHSDAVSNPDGFIHIQITVDENDHCLCNISNSIRKKVEANSPYQGVGLENVKKRLEMQYEDNYQLIEKKKENNYHVYLQIPLERKN